MWIARNKDNKLGLFTNKPFRGNKEDCTIGYWCSYEGWYMDISNYYQFDIKWEDEPLEVKLISKKDLERLEYRASQAPTVPYIGV